MAMPAYVPPAFPCPITSCDIFPFDTAVELADHLTHHYGQTPATGTPRIITSRPSEEPAVITSRPVERRGRFVTVENGFGGTTTKTLAPVGDRASTKQLTYARTLLAEREGIAEAETVRDDLNRRREAGQLTRVVVSEAIDRLLKIRRPRKDEGTPQRFDRQLPDVPEGRYAFTTDEGHTAFCKVEHGTGRWEGRTFVRLLLGAPKAWRTQDLSNGAQLAILRKIAAHGIPESAKRFGDEHGVCGHCCSPLSLKRSIDAGYGADCAEKLGWAY